MTKVIPNKNGWIIFAAETIRHQNERIRNKNPSASLSKIGLNHTANAFWNLSPAELVEHTISRGFGVLADSGALVVDTGKFREERQKINLLFAMKNCQHSRLEQCKLSCRRGSF